MSFSRVSKEFDRLKRAQRLRLADPELVDFLFWVLVLAVGTRTIQFVCT